MYLYSVCTLVQVVAAEGEQKASLHLKEAALVLEESTSALQLRYLQVRRFLVRYRIELTTSMEEEAKICELFPC